MDNLPDDSHSPGEFPFPINRDSFFATTHWSVVSQLAENDPAKAAAALEQLCATYWFPIYAFIRQRGHNPHDAQDLTQSFFAFVLENRTFGKADRQKGSFRTFLKTTVKNFLSNEWDGRKTIKRGGLQSFISLDEAQAEQRYGAEPVDHGTPENFFDRLWARALLEKALIVLRQEYSKPKQIDLFTRLEPTLTGETPPGLYDECAAALGMDKKTIGVAAHRLRHRFGELLREQVAHTVADPADIEAELRNLIAAIANQAS